MKSFKTFCFLLFVLLSFNAHALIIKDVIPVNKILEINWRAYDFDLTKSGYNHLTDTINSVRLSYDFSDMVDEYDDFDDYDTLESIQFNSYIFDGRTIFHDINPGIITEARDWTKDESYCQKEDDDTGECEFNLDLNGTAREFLSVYSGNIWLNDVTLSVDVTRVDVPEPSSVILLILGFLILYFTRSFNKSRKNF